MARSGHEGATLRRWYVAAMFVAALGGCASYAPSSSIIGLSREQVIERLGLPDPAVSHGTSDRLDFPRGPMGKHTYFVYFDDKGRAIRFEQALTEERFSRIVPEMSTEDVIQLIGVSRSTFGLARNRGFVWSYRYENPFCQWFQVEFTIEAKVRSAGYSKAPECRVGRFRTLAF